MEKTKKRGRPALENPTISVHLRLDPGIVNKLAEIATRKKYFYGKKPNVSRAIKEILEKSEING
jgi:hypothetical protein